jgi:excisionase family DNA binding protein
MRGTRRLPEVRFPGEGVTQLARRLLTVSEVAETTGLSSNAVYRAISDGELRASKLRGRLRIQLADLDAWIDSNLVTTRLMPKTPPAPARPLGRNVPGRGLLELLEGE